MDTKKLRQKILDLAIHGKLVPQDPNDEPASVLLERIRAEKERLVKEGKIKKSKATKTSDTPHYEQVPFEVPSSWEWCKLGDIVSFLGGFAYKSNTYVNSSDWQVIRIGNIKNDNLLLNNQPIFVSEEIGKDTQKYLIKTDDILFSMTGTKGKRDYFFSVVVPQLNKKLLLNQRVGCLRKFSKDNNIHYLCLALKGQYVLDAIFSTETGNVSQGNIGSESTLNLDIALPPLPEQIRIVKEVKRLFALIDQIEQGKVDLQTTIKQAKSKILDLAIHGKLVPQDPTDEPASELLKRINPKAEITCDNGQYGKIPENWCVTRIKNAFFINPRNKAEDENNAGFVPMTNICDGYFNRFTYETKKWTEIKTSFTHFANGDIAVAKISPCLENRKSMVLNNLPNGIGAGTTELHVFRPLCVAQSYGLWFFKSDYFVNQCVGSFNGVVGQQRVGKNIVEDILFPLPPLAEQQRIVAKIEELFTSLDNIQKSLEV